MQSVKEYDEYIQVRGLLLLLFIRNYMAVLADLRHRGGLAENGEILSAGLAKWQNASYSYWFELIDWEELQKEIDFEELIRSEEGRASVLDKVNEVLATGGATNKDVATNPEMSVASKLKEYLETTSGNDPKEDLLLKLLQEIINN